MSASTHVLTYVRVRVFMCVCVCARASVLMCAIMCACVCTPCVHYATTSPCVLCVCTPVSLITHTDTVSPGMPHLQCNLRVWGLDMMPVRGGVKRTCAALRTCHLKWKCHALGRRRGISPPLPPLSPPPPPPFPTLQQTTLSTTQMESCGDGRCVREFFG